MKFANIKKYFSCTSKSEKIYIKDFSENQYLTLRDIITLRRILSPEQISTIDYMKRQLKTNDGYYSIVHLQLKETDEITDEILNKAEEKLKDLRTSEYSFGMEYTIMLVGNRYKILCTIIDTIHEKYAEQFVNHPKANLDECNKVT